MSEVFDAHARALVSCQALLRDLWAVSGDELALATVVDQLGIAPYAEEPGVDGFPQGATPEECDELVDSDPFGASAWGES